MNCTKHFDLSSSLTHTRRETFKVVSLHFVPTLQSTICTKSVLCIRSAVRSLHFVLTGIRGQYSLFLVTVIRTTHTIDNKLPVCEFIFVPFRVNTLSFRKNVDITYNVAINPPTQKK